LFIYLTDIFNVMYSGDIFEKYNLLNKMFGGNWWLYLLMLICVLVLPQLFWSKKIRRSTTATLVFSISINIGMWLERFVIIISSSEAPYLTSGWTNYLPSLTAFGIIIGSIGLFFTIFLLLIKKFPFISIYELKTNRN